MFNYFQINNMEAATESKLDELKAYISTYVLMI